MAEQPKIINVNVGEEGAAKLDRIAERFKVSRVKALAWIIDAIEADTFLPYSFLNTSSVSETQTNEVAA